LATVGLGDRDYVKTYTSKFKGFYIYSFVKNTGIYLKKVNNGIFT